MRRTGINPSIVYLFLFPKCTLLKLVGGYTPPDSFAWLPHYLILQHDRGSISPTSIVYIGPYISYMQQIFHNIRILICFNAFYLQAILQVLMVSAAHPSE